MILVGKAQSHADFLSELKEGLGVLVIRRAQLVELRDRGAGIPEDPAQELRQSADERRVAGSLPQESIGFKDSRGGLTVVPGQKLYQFPE